MWLQCDDPHPMKPQSKHTHRSHDASACSLLLCSWDTYALVLLLSCTLPLWQLFLSAIGRPVAILYSLLLLSQLLLPFSGMLYELSSALYLGPQSEGPWPCPCPCPWCWPCPWPCWPCHPHSEQADRYSNAESCWNLRRNWACLIFTACHRIQAVQTEKKTFSNYWFYELIEHMNRVK